MSDNQNQSYIQDMIDRKRVEKENHFLAAESVFGAAYKDFLNAFKALGVFGELIQKITESKQAILDIQNEYLSVIEGNRQDYNSKLEDLASNLNASNIGDYEIEYKPVYPDKLNLLDKIELLEKPEGTLDKVDTSYFEDYINDQLIMLKYMLDKFVEVRNSIKQYRKIIAVVESQPEEWVNNLNEALSIAQEQLDEEYDKTISIIDESFKKPMSKLKKELVKYQSKYVSNSKKTVGALNLIDIATKNEVNLENFDISFEDLSIDGAVPISQELIDYIRKREEELKGYYDNMLDDVDNKDIELSKLRKMQVEVFGK